MCILQYVSPKSIGKWQWRHSWSEEHFKNSKTTRVFYLLLDLFIFVQIFQFYLVTQSLWKNNDTRFRKNPEKILFEDIYSCCLIKRTVSRDFLLLVFFMNQFPPSPRVFHLDRFEFCGKFAEIFTSQGAPPVSTGINDNGGKFATGISDSGGKFFHHFL